jgi:hypothetical protein
MPQGVGENPIRSGPRPMLIPFNFNFVQSSLHLCAFCHATISAEPRSQNPVSLAALGEKNGQNQNVAREIVDVRLGLRVKQDHGLVWSYNTY